MRKCLYLLLVTGCFLIHGCHQRHFEDGFGMVFYAKAYDLKENKCYELDPLQFSDLINSICKKAEKVESPEIQKRIREDLKLQEHHVIRFRYAVSMDDVPDQIEVTSDGYLRDYNGYFLISKTQYNELIQFVKKSDACE